MSKSEKAVNIRVVLTTTLLPFRMLDALHERRAKRSKNAAKDNIFQQQAERLEKVEWKKFWDEESEELLLYACRHGTVEIVDYFLRHSISPTTV